MSDDPKSNREERAVDALITGALHSWSSMNVSEAEVNEFLSTNLELTESEKAALKRVHGQFLSGQTSAEPASEIISDQAMESPYMAMNRENAKDQVAAETREEVERKRAELLAKLKAKKRSAG
ncbi:MAG: hypothetical protein NTZ16_10975 [Verrucomicrobia bacterium]|nr:hypothetical protein [Verrucomicrobiota bacterium]